MALLLASNNSGKLREVRALFAAVEVVAPAALGLDLAVEESGQTFAANAQLKARAYAAASGQIALADDSGLEVDAPRRRTRYLLGPLRWLRPRRRRPLPALARRAGALSRASATPGPLPLRPSAP